MLSAEPPRATLFLLAALAWSVGLFALLRSPWAEGRLVLPLTRLQEQAADYYAGRPPVPIAVTSECSGTDVLALCLAAILACPVPWRARLAGAAGGIALVLALNTLRIATLGRAAASPALFQALHLQVWPAILILATSGYVFAWMRGAWGRAGGPRRAPPERVMRFPRSSGASRPGRRCSWSPSPSAPPGSRGVAPCSKPARGSCAPPPSC
ncbi:MAG TPA: exosortase/archaeosortase family protein [Vicinamibacteria bacterium]|nr:exosortase/archaeosortase family protein [Vicinamibacteria bacterium]